jgi:hypothetical protein
MLKLHHMNLLNEIQETTLMMNLYQQQQLQQQQQQLQQQATVEGLVGADPQLSMMHQQNSMDQLFGAGKLMQHQRGSLGLGTGGGGNFGNPQMQLMQHQMLQQNVGQLSGLQHPNSIGNLPAAPLNTVGKESGAPAPSRKKMGESKKNKKAKDDEAKEEPKEEKETVDEEEDEDDDDDDDNDDDDEEDEENEADEEDGRKAV